LILDRLAPLHSLIARGVRIPVLFDDCRFPFGGEAPGNLRSEKSFANVSEVAGNSRIKLSGISTAWPGSSHVPLRHFQADFRAKSMH
jgi:hypothetical protein